MRHLIDTYIEAEEPRKISPFDDMPLLELIVKTGIAEAITERLGSLKGNQGAIAETIENNVRSKIIKEHLSDPAFYDRMSTLLDEIIAARKAKAIEYEQYLMRIAELVKKVGAGKAENTPEQLNTPGRRALYNLLTEDRQSNPVGAAEPEAVYVANAAALDLVLRIDNKVRHVRPDSWRGNSSKENIIKQELLGILGHEEEVERIFAIIRQQQEY
jgi:type I restriction enzyme R subunit